jgi:peptidoglycan/LPS O-acetylase OafA/YrhL
VRLATTSNLDLLGMGGLLAYLNACSPVASRLFRRGCLLLGAPLYLAIRLFEAPDLGLVGLAGGDLAFAGLCVVLVHHAAVGVRGPARLLLDVPPLQYLGRISYAVYLYHGFAEPALATVFRRAHLSLPAEPGTRFLLFAAATLLVASASWYFFEKPLNDLKRYFPYVCRNPAAPHPVAA